MHRFTIHPFQRFLYAVRLPLTLAVITAAAACIHAAETPWGRIEEAGSAPSRHRFLVERWPADGRIVVPADFPQIVRATMLVDGDRRDLAVEYTEDASQVAILGPANAPTSGLVDVETTDTTAQCGDGRTRSRPGPRRSRARRRNWRSSRATSASASGRTPPTSWPGPTSQPAGGHTTCASPTLPPRLQAPRSRSRSARRNSGAGSTRPAVGIATRRSRWGGS